MLATDYMLQAAVGLLESIRDGQSRLDRTIEVSVINLREKRRLLRLLGPNVRTLDHLMRRNRQDFAIAINKHRPRQAAPRRRGSGWCAGAAGPCGWWKNSACARSDCSRPWTG